MYRSNVPKAKTNPQAPPAGGTALATYDAQLATQQKKAEIEKHRGGRQEVAEYTGPKIKWEDTGLYKAMVKSAEIEEELTKIRNLIRKRTDPLYEPDDEDFNVAPVKKFNVKIDYYKLLDIDDFATAKDIKGAYKKMALQYHPDKNRDKKPDELRQMQEEFEKVQEAYEVLSDRATRRQYDRTKFDEARAKSQGMNSSMYSQKTDTDSNFWGRWTGKKEKKTVSMEDLRALSKTQKVPKAPDLKVEVKISLDKALRGGLKIREVKRDRMQRSFGSTQPNGQVFHVMIEPGQADGSEFRLDGDGNWKDFGSLPGDLVFMFKHKPHAYLRQVPPTTEGTIEVSMPLRVRAKATDHVLSAWTPTFKGQMLLVRFLNPLLEFAPSKACSITFHVEREGLPLPEDKTSRGALRVTVHVQLDGDALVPSLEATCCKQTLLRRYHRSYNHQPHLSVDLSSNGRAGRTVRHHLASVAKERDGRKVFLPAIVSIWEAPPETDPVLFAKAASTLGFQAQQRPVSFLWGYHQGLGRRPLPKPRHFKLGDDEIASDEEDEQKPQQPQQQQQQQRPAQSASLAEVEGGRSGSAFDFDLLDEEVPAQTALEHVAPEPAHRSRRLRTEKEEFLLEFGLGPLDGFPDPGSEDEPGGSVIDIGGRWQMMNLSTEQRMTYEFSHTPGSSTFTGLQDDTEPVYDGQIHWGAISWRVGDYVCRGRIEDGSNKISDIDVRLHDVHPMGIFIGIKMAEGQSAQPTKAKKRFKPPNVQVELDEQDQEGDEEQELTRLIRQKQGEMEQVKRKWNNRKQRIQGEREEEEGTLRELLEKDKKREYDRIEKEMNGLRSNFEFQISAEKRWMEEFLREVHYTNEWVCVFKPAMVARMKPAEDAPVAKRIMFDEVVKAKDKPTDDYWIQLEGSNAWCLIWHQKHGKLLQKWFGTQQQRFLDLDKKIEERRQVRNKTFLDYKRKKKEVSEWSIPPGPSEEERCEIADEEGEHLRNLLEPILKELTEHKRRLRELRRKRLEAAVHRSRKGADGDAGLASGQLPRGFQLEEGPPVESAAPPAAAAAPGQEAAVASQAADGWEAKKQAGDRAFKDKDWNTALSLYSQALEQGGGSLESIHCATLLSNRALVHGKLFDWQKSLEDAIDATIHEVEWPKGWLRRATAELRLYKNKEALISLMRGMTCAGKVASQFLQLITECEAALYSDRDMHENADEDPSTAAERIAKFRDEGSKAFEQGKLGVAVLFYTRALYHRSMMEARDEAIVLSNRSAAFLKLQLPNEALADGLASAEKDDQWAKPLVRAGQAALLLDDFKAAYQYFARARRLEEHSQAASNGVNDCLQKVIKWEYTAATKRWVRFAADRQRPREGLRVWALSDVCFDQLGVPEWCKSLSSSFFRDDILMLAGNLADSLPQLRFALTVLKSKFRRIFYIPGNHDLWVRRATLQTMIRGEKVKNEEREMVDSVSKLLEVLKVCDELGVETAPAEVAGGVFIMPMFSWYSRDFVSRERRKQYASETDADAKITIDQWIKWPFPGGSDDAWKFFMRMNEAALRATLVSKAAFERFSSVQAHILTMTHFLTRPDLQIDWTVPGIWDYIGCDGLDEQIRAVGSDVHVYGHACTGPQATSLEGVHYVHNYIGTTEKHRPCMAPYCIYDRGEVMPTVQPSQKEGFNFQPLSKPQVPREEGQGTLPRMGGWG